MANLTNKIKPVRQYLNHVVLCVVTKSTSFEVDKIPTFRYLLSGIISYNLVILNQSPNQFVNKKIG